MPPSRVTYLSPLLYVYTTPTQAPAPNLIPSPAPTPTPTVHLQALVRLAIAKKLKASGQPKKGDISEALERLLLDDVAAKVPPLLLRTLA